MKNCEQSLDVKKIVSYIGFAISVIAVGCYANKKYKECDKEKLREMKHRAKHFVIDSPERLKHLIERGKHGVHRKEEKIISYLDSLTERIDRLQGSAKDEYRNKLLAIQGKVQKALDATEKSN